MNDNPQKRNTNIMLAIAVFATFMIFFPSLIGLDGFDGGFAISFVSLALSLTFAIVTVIFYRQARLLDNILRGEGLLAHWTYTPQQWSKYSKKEYKTEMQEKRGLFLIVSAFALFFGVLFWVFDNEAGFYVFLMMLGLIGLVAFAWRFSTWLNYRQNTNGTPEVYISKDAVYMNRKLYCWRAPMTNFESVQLQNNRGMTVLAFTYIIHNVKTGNQSYTVRVPVPEDRKEEAEEVLRQVNLQN